MAENRLVVVLELVDQVSSRLRAVAASAQAFGQRLQTAFQQPVQRVQRYLKQIPTKWVRDYLLGVPIDMIAERYKVLPENVAAVLERYPWLTFLRNMRLTGQQMLRLSDRVRRLNWQFTYMLLSMLGIMFNATILGRTLTKWFQAVLRPVQDMAKNLALAAFAMALIGEKLPPERVREYVEAFLEWKRAIGTWSAVFVELGPVLKEIISAIADLLEAVLNFVRQPEVQRYLEEFATGFKETAEWVANFIRQMEPSALEAFGRAVSGLLRNLSWLARILSVIMPEPLKGLFSGFADILGNLSSGFKGVGQAVLPLLALLFTLGTVASFCMMPLALLTFSLASFANFLTVTGGIMSSVVAIIARGFTPAVTALGAALSSPYMWLVLIVAALAALIASLYMTNTAFREAVDTAIAGFKDALAGLAGFLQRVFLRVWNVFATALTPVGEAFAQLYSAIGEFLTAVLELATAIGEALIPAFREIQPVVEPLIDFFLRVFAGALQIVLAQVTVFAHSLAALFRIAAAAIRGEWQKIPEILQETGERIIRVFDPIIATWRAAFESFFRFIVNLTDLVVKHFQGMADSILAIARGFLREIRDMFTGLTGGISGVFRSLSETLVGHSIWTDMLREMLSQTRLFAGQIRATLEAVTPEVPEVRTTLKIVPEVPSRQIRETLEEITSKIPVGKIRTTIGIVPEVTIGRIREELERIIPEVPLGRIRAALEKIASEIPVGKIRATLARIPLEVPTPPAVAVAPTTHMYSINVSVTIESVTSEADWREVGRRIGEAIINRMMEVR